MISSHYYYEAVEDNCKFSFENYCYFSTGVNCRTQTQVGYSKSRTDNNHLVPRLIIDLKVQNDFGVGLAVFSGKGLMANCNNCDGFLHALNVFSHDFLLLN
jgi:hypothetical protein